ncbi:LIC_12096 family protein [Leptospira sp. 'Mane']|uniref:LIC_12096 family protein n=1 Tax=Leptospira sp. 'Mane' TaxID=3387407 RepID=UPI00398A7A19
MKLHRLLLLLAQLSSLIPLCVVSLSAEAAAHNVREKQLDKEILSLYKDLSRARELLSYDKIQAVPGNTNVSFIGSFPNRTGVKIRKFNIDADPGPKGKLRNSEEKSILLEFNGSTLSRVEVSVISEDVQIEQKSKTLIVDTSPLDDNLNDMEIFFSGIDGTSKFALADFANDDVKPERNNFKKDFYIKFLLDFHSQISSILAVQKSQGLKGQKNMLKQLNGSLKY